MRFLIFQHARVEHPGIFREFFAADGIEWHAIELDEGAIRVWMAVALMAFGVTWMSGKSAGIRGLDIERPLSGHGYVNDESPFSASTPGVSIVGGRAGWSRQKMDVRRL